MGCLDGTEVSDLTGLYILSKTKSVFETQNDVGLYRDGGLGIFRNLSGPEIERVRKEIITIFKECGLSLTTKTNLKVVQFLDIELDLINNTYRPYKKPNDNPMYINVKSNHPLSIIKQIPPSINRRLSNLSSDEEVFLNNIQPCRQALKKSGFRDELTYVEPKISEERNNEKRNEKLFGSIHRIQKMLRLTLVRYYSYYYINIFRYHILFINFLIKSQLR